MINALFHSKPILSGVIGTVTSATGSAIAFFSAANVLLAFVAGIFALGTGVCTFILGVIKVREKLEDRRARKRQSGSDLTAAR